jgi:hypothetical protein
MYLDRPVPWLIRSIRQARIRSIRKLNDELYARDRRRMESAVKRAGVRLDTLRVDSQFKPDTDINVGAAASE